MMKRRSAYILVTHLYIVHYDQQFILFHLCHHTGDWHDSESEGEWASDSQKRSPRCTLIVQVQMVIWDDPGRCTQWAEWPAVQDAIFSICKFCIRPNFSFSVTWVHLKCKMWNIESRMINTSLKQIQTGMRTKTEVGCPRCRVRLGYAPSWHAYKLPLVRC